MKVGFIGLGCEKNVINTEQMIYRVQAAGHQIVSDADAADIIVINTCGFIASAQSEAIETILEMAALKKEGKIKKIIVCGCLPERFQDQIANEIPEADAFVGVGSFQDIVSVIDRLAKEEKVCVFAPPECQDMDAPRVRTGANHTAYLKLADGCNNCCSYCAIPAIRGAYRSRSMESIVDEAKALAAEGVKELILIAQDTTLYGTDLYGEQKLVDLLEQLSKIDGVEWIRMLYLYPDKITDELIDIMAREDKLIPYIEMPVQHSEQSVLSRMNRPGGREQLLELIDRIRQKLPQAILRTTLIVGFPGESEEEFEGLCEFVKAAKFDRLGVFAYSREEGTPAFDFDGQIDDAVKARRAEVIEDIQSEIVYEKLQDAVGKQLVVLCEGYDRLAECNYGRSYGEAPDIDGKIFFTGKAAAGQMVRVEITDMLDFDLIGEIVK